MEWVETTGRTIEEAKDAALDQLGVDEQDAEFEVLEEPRTGLFGRTRGEARVRARIEPTKPRPKVERRDRKRRSTKDKPDSGSGSRGGSGRSASTATKERPVPAESTTNADGADGADTAPAAARSSSGGRAKKQRAPRPAGRQSGESPTGETTMTSEDDVNVDEQADLMTTFLEGLLEAFGAEGTVERTKIDDDTIELQVAGDDLGLLIGPKGATLQAVQELARTYVQRKAAGAHHGRVRIDIGGYRQRRREALERFTQQVAEQVIDSGVQKALEPMNAADRKVVHDAVNTIDGVTTSSEGDEPRRRVVISPA